MAARTRPRLVRDSGRHRLSTVEADLRDYVSSAFDGSGIEIELTYGRLVAAWQPGNKVYVRVTGPGGGFCWSDTWSRRRLIALLEAATPDDPHVRRCKAAGVLP